MRSLGSYLLLFFMVIFWIFRIVVSFTSSLGIEIGFTVMDMNVEILLLFVTLISIGLVAKRMLGGAVLYLITYGAYFGYDLFNSVMKIAQGNMAISDYSNAMSSFIAVAIAFGVFFSLLIDKNRTNHPVDKKTDWFYKNDEYDRKLDERADQNEYKNY